FDGLPIEQTASGRRGIDSEGAVYLADRTYVDDARRYDMGERDHFVTMEMATAGMSFVLERGVPEIETYVRALSDDVRAHWDDRIAISGPSAAPHIVSINVPPETSKAICSDLAAAGIHVSPRLGRVRVSPHVYNDAEDIARFNSAFETALARHA
ncbi:MAG: hypothetical protein AAFR23_01555, partial [Pseudomonadota bacterium]